MPSHHPLAQSATLATLMPARWGPALPDRTVPTAIKARSSGWTSSRSWPWMTALLTARSGHVNNAKAALVDWRLLAVMESFS